MLPFLQENGYFWAIITVLVQEGARYLFFDMYVKLERNFSVVATNAIAFPLVDFYSALAAGVLMRFVTCLSHSV